MPALITPFGPDGSVDTNAHRHNVAFLAERGTKGFLIGGSTGQGPYLEPGEHGTLIATARDELGDEAFLLGGVFAQSVHQAARQIAEVNAAGGDAVLVVTPTLLLRGDRELVVSFFRTVADESPLPVFLYTVPAVTGYELPIDAAITLAAHPNIVGMKDSGGDVDRVPPIVTGAGTDFLLYVGASRAIFASTGRGAYGAITASTNYAQELVTAARVDNDVQERLTAMTRNVEQHGIAGTYAAADLVGLSPGTMREPLRPLNDDERSVLRSHCCPNSGD